MPGGPRTASHCVSSLVATLCGLPSHVQDSRRNPDHCLEYSTPHDTCFVLQTSRLPSSIIPRLPPNLPLFLSLQEDELVCTPSAGPHIHFACFAVSPGLCRAASCIRRVGPQMPPFTPPSSFLCVAAFVGSASLLAGHELPGGRGLSVTSHCYCVWQVLRLCGFTHCPRTVALCPLPVASYPHVGWHVRPASCVLQGAKTV